MSQRTFDTAESYLLSHWKQCRELEVAMKATRDKYDAVWQRVAESLKGRHPDFDSSGLYVTQFWSTGMAVFGRSHWPHKNKEQLPGVWIENIRLECLTDPGEPEPIIKLALKPLKQARVDIAPIVRAAESLLQSMSADEVNLLGLRRDADAQSPITAPLASRQELLEKLGRDDSQDFVDLIVLRVESLLPFARLINDT